MLCGFRSRLAPEHHSKMAKTLEVEPTEEKTVKEESSGKLVSPLTHWTLFLWLHKNSAACLCFTDRDLFFGGLVFLCVKLFLCLVNALFCAGQENIGLVAAMHHNNVHIKGNTQDKHS